MPNLFLDYKNMAIHRWLFPLSTLVWSCCQLLRFSIWLYKKLYYYKNTINPMKIYQTNKWLFFLSFISSVLILLKMIEPKWFIELSRKKDDWMYNFSCSTLCDTSLLLMWKNIAYSLVFFILVVLHMLDLFLYALASK